jgi:hypothetical protein
MGNFSKLMISMKMDISDQMKKVGIPTTSFLSSYNVSRLFESEHRYFSQSTLPTSLGEQEEEDENMKCIRQVKFS